MAHQSDYYCYTKKKKAVYFGFGDDTEKYNLTLLSTLPKNNNFPFLFFRHICGRSRSGVPRTRLLYNSKVATGI